MSRHKRIRRNAHAARADNGVHVRGVQFRPKSSQHPLYITREATLLSHSALSCCSIGESNSIAIFF